MNSYHAALFLHLVALLSAIAASTIVHTSMVKIRDAATGGDALQWLGLAHGFARVFPVALAVLVGSGAWMVHDGWPWSSPFVVGGLAGAGFLFVSGAAIEGGRAGSVAKSLAAAPAEPVGDLVRDPLWWCASWANTGVAVAVVFAMTSKPLALATGVVLGAGVAAGAAIGFAARRRRAVPLDLLTETKG